jgi:hypothetical protein
VAKAFLRKRPATALLVLQRSEILHDPAAAASQIGDFLGTHSRPRKWPLKSIHRYTASTGCANAEGSACRR